MKSDDGVAGKRPILFFRWGLNGNLAVLAGLALALAALVGGLAFPNAASAQEIPRQVEALTHEVAFTLYRDKILVQVAIGGETFTGVYDSGAGASVLSTAAATAIAATLTGRSTLNGFGGAVESRLVRDLNVGIGDSQHRYARLPVADLGQFTARFGRPIDFIIGVDAFPDDVVEVDWAASKLRWTPRTRFNPPAGAVNIPFERRNGQYRTMITINGRDATANLDLGSSSALTLSDRFTDRLDLSAASTGMITGIGGDVLIGLGSVNAVAFAGMTFSDVPFVHQPSRVLPGRVDVNVGLPLMAHYRIFLDYRAETAWLAPIADRGAPAFERNTTGLRLGRPARDRLVVFHVGDPSPARAAGLVGGEEILAIDDATVAGMEADTDVFAWTRRMGGEVRLRLADGREVTIARARYY